MKKMEIKGTSLATEKSLNPREVVEQFFAAFNTGNLNNVEKLIAKDVIYNLPPGGDTLRGSEVFMQFLADSRQGFPDKVWTLEDSVVEGEKIAFWATARGTHKADFMGVPPTGKSISVTFFVVWRIKDSQIAEGWALWDIFMMLQQLGVMEN